MDDMRTTPAMRATCGKRRSVSAAIREVWKKEKPRTRRDGSKMGVATRASDDYEAVVGVETHVQLSTKTKAFCACPASYGAEPNAHICPVCAGLPGALPRANGDALRRAAALGLALGCQLNLHSRFDRKQYFYADLPKGYQISQHEVPIAQSGVIHVRAPGSSEPTPVRITRAHMEEDSGKSVHDGTAGNLASATQSKIDLNRAGVPLVEIVSEPDMRSGQEAAEYATELRRIVRYLGVGNGNMQEGSLRCDVNVSVRPKGTTELGTKVEIKNMNSFAAMQKAVDFEVERQVQLLESGEGDLICQETRLWDESAQATKVMRKKEGLADYRYFPEPDLPDIVLTEEFVEEVRNGMPELPHEKRMRYLELGLPLSDALTLADDKGIASFFDACLVEGAAPKAAGNWILNDIAKYLSEEKVNIEDAKLTPAALAEMVSMIEDQVISGKIAKEILPVLLQEGGSPKILVEERGLVQISDTGAIEAMIDEVLAANPKQLEQYRAGRDKLQGFFVGQVMKKSQGKANPALINKILLPKLRAEA